MTFTLESTPPESGEILQPGMVIHTTEELEDFHYKILQSEQLSELEKIINILISEGWILHGQLVVNNTFFYHNTNIQKKNQIPI
jgi:hypothetical protein